MNLACSGAPGLGPVFLRPDAAGKDAAATPREIAIRPATRPGGTLHRPVRKPMLALDRTTLAEGIA